MSTGDIYYATEQLCSTTRSFLGVTTLCTFTGVLPLILGGALYIYKKEDNRMRTIGLALIAIGIFMLLTAGASTVLYVFTPALVGALTGMNGIGC